MSDVTVKDVEKLDATPRNYRPWNRCDYCGLFISYNDFDTEKAHTYMLTPDTDFTVETWTTYHVACARNPRATPDERGE